MMNKYIAVLIFVIGANQYGVAQRDEQNFFEPPVEDIQKKNKNPELLDSLTKRLKIKYQFFSTPYDSSFEPAKGEPILLRNKFQKEKSYDNYMSVGYGSFNSLIADGYIRRKVEKRNNLNVEGHHHSSQNSILDNKLDSYFSDTEFAGTYLRDQKKYIIELNGLLSNKVYNWYGLPSQISFSEQDIDNIKPQQSIYNVQTGIRYLSKDTLGVKKSGIDAYFLADDFENTEIHFLADLKSSLIINGDKVHLESKVDYTGTAFSVKDITKGFTNFLVKVSPYIQKAEGNIKIKAGVSMFYNNAAQKTTDGFDIYPKLEAVYNLISDYVVSYGEVTGQQISNTYSNFLKRNRYLNPTGIDLKPTNEKLKILFGIKGKLLKNLSYNLKGYAKFVEDYPLFVLSTVSDEKIGGFSYGNSFKVIYDSMQVFSSYGELSWTIEDQANIMWNIEIVSYSSNKQDKVWNIPSFKSSILANYNIAKYIYLTSNLFFVGTRYDLFSQRIGSDIKTSEVELSSYFDANIHVGYYILENISTYMRLNNIFSQNYQKWANYRVQGFQFVVGATYKF